MLCFGSAAAKPSLVRRNEVPPGSYFDPSALNGKFHPRFEVLCFETSTVPYSEKIIYSQYMFGTTIKVTNKNGENFSSDLFVSR